jgi:MoaF N-terminal domain
LTRFGSELSFCAPSDYVRIDDDLYIYSRTECEFSGIMTLYVLDANRVEQVGVRLGFDAADALEYYVFRGTGEWLSSSRISRSLATWVRTLRPGPARDKPRRYRPKRTLPMMTKAEVDAAARNATVFPPGGSMAGNKLPVGDFLSGRELTLRFDNGPVLEYRFDEVQTLRWRREGESAWHEEGYESWESAPGVFMFGHLLGGEPAHDSFVVVADFEHGLATCLHATMGAQYYNNEAVVETLSRKPGFWKPTASGGTESGSSGESNFALRGSRASIRPCVAPIRFEVGDVAVLGEGRRGYA